MTLNNIKIKYFGKEMAYLFYIFYEIEYFACATTASISKQGHHLKINFTKALTCVSDMKSVRGARLLNLLSTALW